MTAAAPSTPSCVPSPAAAAAAPTVAFTLNGQPVALAAPPGRRLLALLREDLGLVGAKPGCAVGRCGACMVWLDDEPVNACLVMAWQLDGRRVTTVEGLADDPRALPVRDALARQGAVQCGYCSAGLVMGLTWLHGQATAPDRDAAAAQLCGHLCRCTGYGGLQRTLDLLFGAPAGPAAGSAAGSAA